MAILRQDLVEEGTGHLDMARVEMEVQMEKAEYASFDIQLGRS